MVEGQGQPRLAADLYTNVSVVSYDPPEIKLHLHQSAADHLIKRLRGFLNNWFGQDWIIQSMPNSDTAPLAQQDQDAEQAKLEKIKSIPPVKNILDIFPEATILGVKDIEQKK
jgi:hypothetical protein